MSSDTQKVAVAAHLYSLMRRKLNHVIDVELAARDFDYANEVIEAARASSLPDLHHWADKFEALWTSAIDHVTLPAPLDTLPMPLQELPRMPPPVRPAPLQQQPQRQGPASLPPQLAPPQTQRQDPPSTAPVSYLSSSAVPSSLPPQSQFDRETARPKPGRRWLGVTGVAVVLSAAGYLLMTQLGHEGSTVATPQAASKPQPQSAQPSQPAAAALPVPADKSPSQASAVAPLPDAARPLPARAASPAETSALPPVQQPSAEQPAAVPSAPVQPAPRPVPAPMPSASPVVPSKGKRAPEKPALQSSAAAPASSAVVPAARLKREPAVSVSQGVPPTATSNPAKGRGDPGAASKAVVAPGASAASSALPSSAASAASTPSAASVSASASVVIPPKLNFRTDCGIPPYPHEAQLDRATGQTWLRVSVGTDGHAADIQVVRSSGSTRAHKLMDRALIATVRDTCKFVSGTVDGKPQLLTKDIIYVWNPN